MKDMVKNQRATIQTIKDESQVEGEVDLARKKRKAITLSPKDRLRQELEVKEELLKKTKLHLDALNQKKAEEENERKRFELEK